MSANDRNCLTSSLVMGNLEVLKWRILFYFISSYHSKLFVFLKAAGKAFKCWLLLCVGWEFFSHAAIQELPYSLWENFLHSFWNGCMANMEPHSVLSKKHLQLNIPWMHFFLSGKQSVQWSKSFCFHHFFVVNRKKNKKAFLWVVPRLC